MAQPSDLEARVAALKARVGELAGEAQAAREDAAAARHLAAANDRDVAELRSEIRDFRQAAVVSFNAMRSDLTDVQTEMRTGFTEGLLEADVAGVCHAAQQWQRHRDDPERDGQADAHQGVVVRP